MEIVKNIVTFLFLIMFLWCILTATVSVVDTVKNFSAFSTTETEKLGSLASKCSRTAGVSNFAGFFTVLVLIWFIHGFPSKTALSVAAVVLLFTISCSFVNALFAELIAREISKMGPLDRKAPDFNLPGVEITVN